MNLRIRLMAPDEMKVGDIALAVGIRVDEDNPNTILMRPGILEWSDRDNGWTPVEIWNPESPKAGSA